MRAAIFTFMYTHTHCIEAWYSILLLPASANGAVEETRDVLLGTWDTTVVHVLLTTH